MAVVAGQKEWGLEERMRGKGSVDPGVRDWRSHNHTTQRGEEKRGERSETSINHDHDVDQWGWEENGNQKNERSFLKLTH